MMLDTLTNNLAQLSGSNGIELHFSLFFKFFSSFLCGHLIVSCSFRLHLLTDSSGDWRLSPQILVRPGDAQNTTPKLQSCVHKVNDIYYARY